MKKSCLLFANVLFFSGLSLLWGNAFGQCAPCSDSPNCPIIPSSGGTHTVIYCDPFKTCSFIVPNHVSAITVETIGGGGGGGGAYARSRQSGYEACAAGGGGGGGGYSRLVLNVQPAEEYRIFVGKGGTGGVGTGGSNAANGGENGGKSYIMKVSLPDTFVPAEGGKAGGGAYALKPTSGTSDVRVNGTGGSGGHARNSWYKGGDGRAGITGGSYDKGGLAGSGAGSDGPGNNGPASNNDNSESGAASKNECGGGGGGRTCRAQGNGGSGCFGVNGGTYGGGGSGGVAHRTYSSSGTTESNGGNGSHGMVRITYISALAVTLTDFSISCENGRMVNWTTQSEKNSSHFIVERSRDGANWFEIARVEGAGTTAQEQKYAVEDKSASYETSYYRLKQFDYDGRLEIYDVIASDCSGNNGMIVYPNPAQNSFVVEINSDVAFEGKVVVYDVSGKALIEKELDATKGISVIYFDNVQLAEGTYIVMVERGDKERFQPVKLVVR